MDDKKRGSHAAIHSSGIGCALGSSGKVILALVAHRPRSRPGSPLVPLRGHH